MLPTIQEIDTGQAKAVNKAFSKQSFLYDEEDERNLVLRHMREQVYAHVKKNLNANANVLELNAGTGIDALKFVSWGHHVLATDLSDGMIAQINKKIEKYKLAGRLKSQQLSYQKLNTLNGQKFDFVFSNFGGLNCIRDLRTVTHHLPALLTQGAYVTWVIMPPVYLWELAGVFKGHGKKAFRRFSKNGVRSHLKGEYFDTYYHSLSEIKSAFGKEFKFISTEGLAAISPPPHRGDFPVNHPVFYRILNKLDGIVRPYFPFNRWADHIIVTFQFTK